MAQPAMSSDRLISSAQHYENFPVASVLVPARLRPAIAAVYRFARFADDIADEGDLATEQRLAQLQNLHDSLRGGPVHPVVQDLLPHIQAHAIPITHFTDLLSAFSQDAVGAHYPDRTALLDYCRRSADPVGRIVLRVFDADHHEQLSASDAICSALQLINFCQDMGQDIARGRCYVPADEMKRVDVNIDDLLACAQATQISSKVRALLNDQCHQAHALLAQGIPLLKVVPGRLRFELGAIMAGGLTTVKRVQREDPFASRIKLGKADAPGLLASAVSILVRGKLR